jgi:tetratricopeptide (TPR) repeat protein
MSASTRRWIGLAAVIALLAGLSPLFLVRVPPGFVLLRGDDPLGSGWHAVWPGQARVRIPLSEDRTLEQVPVPLPGELRLGLRLGMHLAVDPGSLRLDARTVREAGGLEGYLTGLAGEAAVKVLEAQPRADPLLAEVTARLSEAIAATLSGGGLALSNVTVEFLETDALRRLRRRRARDLVRPDGRKVMLVGLDGADWQILDPLLDRGKLPALAALLRRGARADLRSSDPMLSPLLWTTAATGKPPEEHGIMDFLLVDPDSGRRVPMSSRFRRVKALWNILTDVGMESGFIAWWATWPAERVSGTLVTDRVSYSLFAGMAMEPGEGTAGLTFPPGYIGEVGDRLVSPEEISYEEVRRFLRIEESEFRQGRELLGAPPASPPEHPVVALARVLASTRSYHSLALDLIERGQPELLAVYYEGIDQVGHRFQHYMPPRMESVSEADHARYREAVPAFYAYQDELLGELVRNADPQTVFLILSDHGFRNGAGRPVDLPPYVSEKPGLWHRRYGVFVLAGPGVRPGRIDTVTLFDIAPTTLHLLGLPRAEDMPGRVLHEALKGGDATGGEPYRIATYEGFGDRYQAPATAASGGAAVEAEMIRELTALGYLSADAGEGAPAGAEGAPGPGEGRVTANYHLNLASILASQGKYDEAEAEARAALALAPLPDGFRILSQVLERKGDLAGAIDAARRVLASAAGESPGDGQRLRLVGLLLDAGRLDEARREAGGEFRDGAFRRTAQGLVAEKDGRRQEAVELYRAALAERPTLAAALERLYPLLPGGEVPALEPLVRRALEENDQLAAMHNVLGVILKRRGDLAGAIASYRRALALDPDKVEYLANLGSAEMIRGNLEEAQTVLERARRKDPDNPDVWLNLGSVHGKAGRPRQSLEAYDRAEGLGAEGPGLAVGRIVGYLMLDDAETAGRLLAEARQRYPEDPTLLRLQADLR